MPAEDAQRQALRFGLTLSVPDQVLFKRALRGGCGCTSDGALVSFLEHEDPQARRCAVWSALALALRCGRPEIGGRVLDLLVDCLSDESVSVREAALRSIAALQLSITLQGFEMVAAALVDENSDVRRAARAVMRTVALSSGELVRRTLVCLAHAASLFPEESSALRICSFRLGRRYAAHVAEIQVYSGDAALAEARRGAALTAPHLFMTAYCNAAAVMPPSLAAERQRLLASLGHVTTMPHNLRESFPLESALGGAAEFIATYAGGLASAARLVHDPCAIEAAALVSRSVFLQRGFAGLSPEVLSAVLELRVAATAAALIDSGSVEAYTKCMLDLLSLRAKYGLPHHLLFPEQPDHEGIRQALLAFLPTSVSTLVGCVCSAPSLPRRLAIKMHLKPVGDCGGARTKATMYCKYFAPPCELLLLPTDGPPTRRLMVRREDALLIGSCSWMACVTVLTSPRGHPRCVAGIKPVLRIGTRSVPLGVEYPCPSA